MTTTGRANPKGKRYRNVLTATYKCGHTKSTDTPRVVEMAKNYYCEDCKRAQQAAYESEHGHDHPCSCCADTRPIVSGCHCANSRAFLICDACKELDAISRKGLTENAAIVRQNLAERAQEVANCK